MHLQGHYVEVVSRKLFCHCSGLVLKVTHHKKYFLEIILILPGLKSVKILRPNIGPIYWMSSKSTLQKIDNFGQILKVMITSLIELPGWVKG